MTLLNKNDILSKDDSKHIDVEVPEWGGTVRIATMSGFARDRFEASVMSKSGGVNHVNIRAKLVAACLVDEKGALMFNEKDVTELGKKSAKALDLIFDRAQSLNGIGDAEIETLAKN